MAEKADYWTITSPEHATIVENTSLLIDTFALNVDIISNLLISKGLIQSKDLREILRMRTLEPSRKAEKIVDHIADSIKTNSSKYNIFIQVLESLGDYSNECVMKLKDCYDSKKVASAFDKDSPSFACPYCQKCSFENYSKRGCPNAVGDNTSLPAAAKLRFIDTRKLSERDKDILDMQLSSEFDEIEGKFTEFFLKVSSFKFPLVELKSFLLSKSVFTSKEKEEFENAKSTRDILHALSSHYSFFNYEIIQTIIERFGSTDEKKQLQIYLVKFNEYCKRSMFEVPHSSRLHPALNIEENQFFAFKYSQQKAQSITMHHVTSLCRRFAMILEIRNPWVLCLLSIEDGCVLLIFAMPKIVSKDVFPIKPSHQEALGEINCKLHSVERESQRLVSYSWHLQLHHIAHSTCIYKKGKRLIIN